MAEYKLIYFDARGRAELARILFHAAGQSFEDVRLTSEKFQELKPDLPFGQLPVLQVDGAYYAQSLAIATYLAKEFGFYGKSNLEAFRIDEVLHTLNDLATHMIRVYHEKDEAKKEELRKTAGEALVKYFKGLEKLLEQNNGYFAGSEVSVADIATFDMGDMLQTQKLYNPDDYPVLKANAEKVASHPKIAPYLKERK